MSWLSLLVFFFKQKTAYEIPKRDWSSDVCSSDLVVHAARTQQNAGRDRDAIERGSREGPQGRRHARDDGAGGRRAARQHAEGSAGVSQGRDRQVGQGDPGREGQGRLTV